MRFYDGKVMQRGFARRFRRHAESRDAIVWDIDAPNQIARCKIQGTDEYVLCHYPKNWQTLPYWCKRGNAVRIAHKGGVRGYLEIVGNGRAIPTPVSGPALPTPQSEPDILISGGGVEPFDGMTLYVEPTTARINGSPVTMQIVYGIIMNDPAPMTMAAASTELMGAGAGVYLTLDTAPAAGLFRYDLIVLGADGLAHVVKGTAAASPSMPATPADHIKIAHVLVVGGATEIELQYINALFETLRLSTVALEFSGAQIQNRNEFLWHLTNNAPTCTVTVKCYDQYGNLFAAGGTVTIDFLSGSGSVSANGSDYVAAGNAVSKSIGSSADFTYKRDQLATPEQHPVFTATLTADLTRMMADLIVLLSSGGTPI